MDRSLEIKVLRSSGCRVIDGWDLNFVCFFLIYEVEWKWILGGFSFVFFRKIIFFYGG